MMPARWDMEKIVILGNGGHANSIVDAIEKSGRYDVVGYVINTDTLHDRTNYPVIGNDDDLEKIFQSGIRNAAIGVGYLGKSKSREKLYKRVKEVGFELPIICDPTAILANDVVIGEGSFISKGAIINANATIGKMCIINSGAIVEHNCQIEDFAHVSVGSVLCGEVIIGRASFVGANATIIQTRRIGKNCIIGAGTVIRKDVEDESMVCTGGKNLIRRM